jgi:hypothetical protein
MLGQGVGKDCWGETQESVKRGHTFLSHLALAFAQCTQAMGILSIEASIFGQKAERQSWYR